MKAGLVIYQGLCLAPKPAVALREMSDADLELLSDFLSTLTSSGFPGVAKSQVQAEAARRWKVEQQAARLRVAKEEER